MENFENKLKKELNKINFNDNSEDQIKNNIYTKYKRNQRNKKIILSVITCFIIVLSSLGIVYADEIKEKVEKILTKTTNVNKDGTIKEFELLHNGEVEINNDAKLNEPKCNYAIDNYNGITEEDECYSLYSYEEIEKILNIKLLKSGLFKNDNLILRQLNKKENKIANLTLEIKNIYGKKRNNDYDKSLVSFSIMLHTKYDAENTNNIFSTYVYEGEEDITEYKIEKLNITAYARNIGTNSSRIWFIYDDIIYKIDFELGYENKKMNKEEIKELKEKEIQLILDSLTY